MLPGWTIATHPGCTNGDIDAHARSVDPASEKQVGGYIKVLRERFRMIDRLQPLFAHPTSLNGRSLTSHGSSGT